MNNLKGSGVAIVTPFLNDGTVDAIGLERLTERIITQGINYIVLLGTTGETATLTKAEKELVKTEERLISRQFRNATERYKALLKYNADLVQRVQLGHIASYLGITQVSLSRIRAEIK